MIFISKIKSILLNIFWSKIFFLFLVSFLVRFYFIFNNSPFVFHPDEPTIINSTINLRYNLNPKHFDWPTTYYYINYPLYNLYERFVGYSERNNLGFQFENFDYYLITRTLTCIFGSLNVLVIYYILKYLGKSEELSIIGSVIFSLFSFHIARSALALADVPMVFFASLSFMFLVRNLQRSSNLNFILSSFFAGLSVSTKYNGYMVFFSIILYFLLIKKLSFKDLGFYFWCGVSSILGFFVGTPYAFLDWKTFSKADSPKGAFWQFENVGRVDFITQFKSFFINFYNISDLVNYIPMILVVVFIFLFIFNKRYKSFQNYPEMIILLQFLFIMWSVSGVAVQRSQYFILALPFIAVICALQLDNFKNYIKVYALFLLFSVFGLITLNDENPLVYFYRNVVVIGDKSNLNILYDDSDTKLILDKLKIASDKLDVSKIKSKDSHILTGTNLCDTQYCRFKQVSLIETPIKKDKLYIYEIKR